MAEQTYMIFYPTRLAFLKWYIIAAFLFAVGVLVILGMLPLPSTISSYNVYFFAVLIAFGIVLTGIAEILRSHDKYAITNFRVVEKTGIISIKEDSIYWEKLSNYSLKQNFFERILNIGTIELWSVGGEEAPEVILKSVPKVKRIKILLDKLIQKR